MLGFLERRGWIVLAVLAGLILLFGIGDIVNGLAADPAIAYSLTGRTPAELRAESAAAYRVGDVTARGLGSNLVVIALLLLVILAVPYRAGRRWAWCAMWLLPLWGLSAAALLLFTERAPGTPPPPPMISGPVFFVIGAAVLIGSARRFRRPVELTSQERGMT